jgi:hypothetical protein
MVRRSSSSRLILGLIVITLGVLWTLDNLGLADSEAILAWWPAVVIAIGVAKFFGLSTPRHPIWGATFIVAGSLLLAGNLGYLRFGIWHLWPLALIAIGANMLVRANRPAVSPGVTEDRSERLDGVALLSGFTRRIYSPQFHGGWVTAIMGGAEVDLRQATPVEGGAVLDLFVWWGGVVVRVPEDWKVINGTTTLMGGIEEKTKAAPPESRHVLVLRGLILMGGVEIKN